MPIQALLFDLDETLILEEASVAEAFRATCHIAQERYGIDPEALTHSVREHARELWHSFPTHEYCMALGMSSWEGLSARFEGDDPRLKRLRALAPAFRREAWFRALAEHGVRDAALVEELAAAFIAERRRRHVPFPDAKSVLEELRRSYRLALVTNGPPDLQREKLEISRLAPYFELVIISGELGIGKPDPRIFEHTLRELSLSPKEAAMIGNSLERDVVGAKQVGLYAVWVKRPDSEIPLQGSECAPDGTVLELSELPKVLARLD